MWTERDIGDLTGRVAVVTGANGGLGLATTKALVDAGAHVVMAARNQEKAKAAIDSIKESSFNPSVELIELNLANLESIAQAATTIASDHDRVDILVNNAGVMATAEAQTDDGFEMQFGVNHLGHWALTARLMPAILAAEQGRVVTVSSTAHHIGKAVDPDDPHLTKGYGPWKAYGRAKLANFHFGIGLNRQFVAAGKQAQSLIAHPGLSSTDLQARSVTEGHGGFMTKFFHGMTSVGGTSPHDGARPQLRAATDPNAKGGEFYGPRFVNFGPAVRLPVMRLIGMDSAIEKLWLVSERETGIALTIN